MRDKKKYFKLIKLIIIFKLLLTNFSFSEIINEFKISGNERLSKETIIMFSNLQMGKNITTEDLNNSLKDLFATNYFSNVSLSIKNGVVIIDVKENPIIQSIIINGIDKNSVYDQVLNVTRKIEKYPFIESNINDQIKLLKNILKNYGYYFVELKALIIQNKNNTVDLIYNFNLGEIAKISKIRFIGDKYFRDSKLRNVIISEETKFWKFITKNKFLNSNRIKLDVSRLKNYYKNRGFYNVDVKSTTALINANNQFELIFNINSGKKFYFNEVRFEDNDNIDIESLDKFKSKFNKLIGKKYSEKKLKDQIDEINNYVLVNDLVFISANYKEIPKIDDKIDVLIFFDALEKLYVERINIFGNYITDEKVLRNNFIVDEGDPYNVRLFEKSIQNLKAKGIFNTIKYDVLETEDKNKIINIEVEEKATGELFAGAGTGTDGSTLTAGIKENNYLGLGIKLDTNATITTDSIKGKFSVINPNYNNSDKSINTSIESSTNDFMSTSGYKTSRTGITLGTEFEQKSNLFVNLQLSNFYEDLITSSSATSILKKQEGNYFENLISYTLTYNKLDQNFQPSDGFINKFSQTLPIYSDDMSIENSFTSTYYESFGDNLILSASFFLKAINALEDNVRVSKRVYIPSKRLRGFETGKIGPKDGTQYIGGNYASSLNLSSTLPNILFENENLDLNFFLDLANVWEVDFDKSLDSNKIRSATGVAFNWYSPIGPLTFSYAIPISEADTDVTEKFRFQIGTSF